MPGLRRHGKTLPSFGRCTKKRIAEAPSSRGDAWIKSRLPSYIATSAKSTPPRSVAMASRAPTAAVDAKVVRVDVISATPIPSPTNHQRSAPARRLGTATRCCHRRTQKPRYLLDAPYKLTNLLVRVPARIARMRAQRSCRHFLLRSLIIVGTSRCKPRHLIRRYHINVGKPGPSCSSARATSLMVRRSLSGKNEDRHLQHK